MSAVHEPQPAPRMNNGGRDALIEAAIAAIATKGTGGVRPNELCRDLGVSKSLVNFHFGGRDGLIAEALAVSYERYVDELWAAAESAGPSAFDRLLAWMMRQVSWTIDNPGIAAGLNFPLEAGELAPSDDDELYVRLNDAGSRNFRNLDALVRAAATELAPERTKERSTAELALDAAITGWLTLGLSVWAAGNHLPTRTLGAREFIPLAQERIAAMLRAHLSA